MRFRSIGAAAVTVAVVVGLSACSGGSSGGSSSKTLSYWATNMAPTLADDTTILTPELAKFTAQTGIKVNLEVISWDSLYNRILTAVSSGQGPDVLNIGNTWSPALQATGAFSDFDSKALTAIGGKDKFIASSMSATGAVGKTPTSVPIYGQAYGLFYNTKLFKEAGISSPPATWADFVADAKKLTHGSQYGITLNGANIADLSHAAFINGRQQGASLFDASGKPTFNSAAEIQAVTRYIGLMANDKVVDPGDAAYTSDTQSASDLANGKAAMFLSQSSTRTTLEQLKFKDWAVAQPPVLDPLPAGGKATQTMVAGINISVFKSSKNQDGAMQLVKFLTSTDEQKILNTAYSTLPVLSDLYSDSSFNDKTSATFGTILKAHAEPMPQIAAEGQMETLVGGALKKLFAKAAGGTVTPADVQSQLTSANTQMAAAG